MRKARLPPVRPNTVVEGVVTVLGRSDFECGEDFGGVAGVAAFSVVQLPRIDDVEIAARGEDAFNGIGGDFSGFGTIHEDC